MSPDPADEEPMMHAARAPSGAVVAAVGFALATLVAPSARVSELFVSLVPVAAALAIVVGVVSYRPVRPMPWLMLALGMLGLAAASVAWSEAFFDGNLGYPGIGEAVGALAYPAIFVGVIGITSRQRGARDLLGGAEPVIYTIALTALVWLAVMEPWFDRRKLPVDGSQWIWLFVGLDVLLALLVYRRADVWAAGRRVLLLLAGGFSALAGAHALVGWQRDAGSIHPGSLAASSMIVAPAVIGVAALIPSMAAPRTGAEQALRLRWSQLAGLAIAALVPVGAMALMLLVDEASRATVTVISASTLGIVLLSLTRMWGLVNKVRELTERQGHDRLAAMVEHSSDVVLLADQRGAVSYASPGLLSTLGHQPATWVGRHLVDVIADEERGKVGEPVAALARSRQRQHRRVRGDVAAGRRPSTACQRRDRQPARRYRSRRHRRDVPRHHRAAQPRTPAQPSRVPRRAHRSRQPGAVPRPHGPRTSRGPIRARSGGRAVRRPRRLQGRQRRARSRGR